MGCHGLHCEGCRHRGGGAAGAVIALLVIVALALRKAWPAIVSALEIAAWTVVGLAGAAITVTCVVLAVRMARRHRARRAVVYRPGLVIRPAHADRRPVERPAHRPAIGRGGQRPAGAWPLPGWWDEIRPTVGRDGSDGPGAGS